MSPFFTVPTIIQVYDYGGWKMANVSRDKKEKQAASWLAPP